MVVLVVALAVDLLPISQRHYRLSVPRTQIQIYLESRLKPLVPLRATKRRNQEMMVMLRGMLGLMERMKVALSRIRKSRS